MSATLTPPVYLGVQFKSGRTSAHISRPLLQRMARKATGWKTKCLNQKGRLVLIKNSLLPTANHIMQSTLLPMQVHKEIDKIIRNFFWGPDASTRKLHPMGWDKLSKPIAEGSLGIRRTLDHNKALLLKRVWQIHDQPDSIYTSMCRDKYLNNEPFLQPPNPTPTPQQPNLETTLSYIKPHIFHKIGTGNSVRTNSNWILDPSPKTNARISISCLIL